MAFINLTPHVLSIHLPSGEVMNIPPSGEVARCAARSEQAGDADGVPLARTSFGEVQTYWGFSGKVGLPAPAPGVWLVVSALVRAAVPLRGDVLSPGELVRGADGQPVGCRGLVCN